jgi:myo-inositol-1(or 4)-monophosphatase
VAARKSLADCVVSIGLPHKGRPDHARFLSECRALMAQVGGLRRTGSAAIDLAWVASGRFDGYVERHLAPWDMAAGTLLVREAGGFVTDLDGGQRMLDEGSIVAGNQTVQKALLATLAGCGQAASAPQAPGPQP